MSAPVRVLVIGTADRILLDLLRANEALDVCYEPDLKDEEIGARLATGFEVLVTRYGSRIDRSTLDKADQLRLITQGTSGLDNIDVRAANEKGILVRGTPGLNANAVAELTIGHMLALTRTVGVYDRSMRASEWAKPGCASRRELRGYRLGLVGLGRVGSRVAALAQGFGVNVSAFDPYLDASEFALKNVTRAETLDDLIRTTDILSLHVPLTEETRGMIGPAQLELLPELAFVINTSRGPVVDESGLLERLERGGIAGIALDVYDEEPPSRTWPDLPNLILTPHIAGCTKEAKEDAARAVYVEIESWISNRRN